MSERTTSRVIPRLGPNDSIPLLTEVVELPDAAAAPSDDGVIDTAGMAESGVVTHVGDTGEPDALAIPVLADELEDGDTALPVTEPEDTVASRYASDAPGEDDLRAMRSELLTRVMMRFRTEWPQVVEAHTEATLRARLAPLTAQLAAELTQALEARLVEWLDATLEEIERDPGGM
ncbi:hypothetical protein CupriaWKF_13300 [Cupriavidus sp. WKF15]|uniref:hypothetical protein n=1 Tax=Cupriavidus sp. WKF15 TaxID=3032282 RepID=UPI0023E30591|nr:hypothetical protein [Cupriavidus sp. WKF15]WER45271.1 hypothetical protein CupriaWKF_13300 [Cupriavidus sp. WKF15]